jgi:putative transposase
MKTVADTLAIAPSNLIERVTRPRNPRGPYRKRMSARATDIGVSPGWWTGCKKPQSKPNINAKRVLRIMQANELTLERHTGRRPGRTHDGIVIALRSNTHVPSLA